MLCLLYLYVCVCVSLKMRNKGKLSLSLASLPVTKGTHSRLPVLVAGFVESQCRHLGWVLRRVSACAAHNGAPGAQQLCLIALGAPGPLCARFSSFFHLHFIFHHSPPTFFFFFSSLSPLTGTRPPSPLSQVYLPWEGHTVMFTDEMNE